MCITFFSEKTISLIYKIVEKYLIEFLKTKLFLLKCKLWGWLKKWLRGWLWCSWNHPKRFYPNLGWICIWRFSIVSKTCGLKKKRADWRGKREDWIKTRGFKKLFCVDWKAKRRNFASIRWKMRRFKTHTKITPDKLPTLAVMNVRFLICKMKIVIRKVMTYKVFHESINSD